MDDNKPTLAFNNNALKELEEKKKQEQKEKEEAKAKVQIDRYRTSAERALDTNNLKPGSYDKKSKIDTQEKSTPKNTAADKKISTVIWSKDTWLFLGMCKRNGDIKIHSFVDEVVMEALKRKFPKAYEDHRKIMQ